MDKLKWIENFEDRIDPEILNIFPYNFLKNNCFIPVNGENGEILIITNNPLNLDIGEIKTILKREIRIALSSEEKINEFIEKFYYHPSSSKKVIDDLSTEESLHLEEDIDTETSNLLDLANKAPVIRIVNQIIYRA
ncbi:MAG: hypothetical protein NC934_06605, partial [Candidatus Omnitrophica bacterium]|nr:hypothetical protein [Candidatus Omnitrophota bacterium]